MRNIFVFILLLNSVFLIGQPVRLTPKTGEPLPNFTLTNVKYYKEKTITNGSFKGKWLILHFWSLGCSAGVKSLDKANAIQNEFRDELQVILIGHKYGDINERIETVFERKKETNDYDLPIAYDTLLYADWSLRGVPTIYIVNPQGILKYITSGSDLTIKKIRDMLTGNEVSLRPLNFNYSNTSGKGLFNDKLDYQHLIYSSVLSGWDGEYPYLGYELDRFVKLPDHYKQDGWSVAFATLTRLYQYAYYGQGWFFPADTAYYGKVFENPIIEVSDKTPFTSHDFSTGEGYYNYFLKLPLQSLTKDQIMTEMQMTLSKNFEYSAQIENREMPVWWLKASPKTFELLKTKGGEPKFFGINSVAGVKVRNYPIKDFLRLVTANLPNDGRFPFLDITGIDFGVDANIQADMTDFDSVQKALSEYGLELVKGAKEMRVLVIRDSSM